MSNRADRGGGFSDNSFTVWGRDLSVSEQKRKKNLQKRSRADSLTKVLVGGGGSLRPFTKLLLKNKNSPLKAPKVSFGLDDKVSMATSYLLSGEPPGVHEIGTEIHSARSSPGNRIAPAFTSLSSKQAY